MFLLTHRKSVNKILEKKKVFKNSKSILIKRVVPEKISFSMLKQSIRFT